MKFFLLLILAPLYAFADSNGLQVQGTCNIKVTPDMGSVSFTAENQLKSQEEAVKKTTLQINKLKESLLALKLEKQELKTTSYEVSPVKEWEKDKQVDKGFRASMTVEISTSDIPRLGEALMAASKNGITNVGSMMTYLSVEKSQAEYLKCLDIASDDAFKKAQQLAKKLGFKVGDVLNLIETPMNNNSPQPYRERILHKSLNAMSDSAPASVDAGTQAFSTQIQVTFKIK